MALVKTTNRRTPSFSSLFDEFFNNELSNYSGNNGNSSRNTLPQVNISENQDQFSVEVAAPGLNKEDFNLEIDDNTLTISSETQKESSQEDENKQYAKREFSYSSFKRSFTLPDTADTDKIEANYENGILNIHIPKKEESKPKPPRSISIS